MDQPKRLCARRPLSGLGPRERHALHRRHGMHSPNSTIRTGNDAFEVRCDVTVEDACHTSLRLARMIVAQLDLLSTDADLGASHRDVVEGIACLTRSACGSIGLVRTALCGD
jgi:hypothetical protein